MKILIVAPYFYPKIGGVEKHSFNLSKGLKEKYNWEVVVITSNHEEKIYKEDLIDGIKIYRLASWFKISNTPINPLWYFQIKKIIKKEKPDIINAHSPVPFIADLAVLTKKNIPAILKYHSGSMKKEEGLFSNLLIYFYEKFVLKFIINKVDYLICTSDFVRNNFLKDFKSKSITITPSVDIKTFKPQKEINQKLHSVLFVGRIDKSSKWKGLNYLMDAFLLIIKNIPTARLSIVGGGDGLAELIEYAKKLKIYLNVDFYGSLSGKELIKKYQESSLLVLPSTTNAEAFGMVLIEAMACKKPVIGTKIGGIPSVIDNNINGLLVEPKNSKQLAKAIIKIIEDPKLAKKMGENGYKKVIKYFTLDKQLIKTQNLIMKVYKI